MGQLCLVRDRQPPHGMYGATRHALRPVVLRLFVREFVIVGDAGNIGGPDLRPANVQSDSELTKTGTDRVTSLGPPLVNIPVWYYCQRWDQGKQARV